MTAIATAPIGVFDSGIGGLSVLNALQRAMPLERFVYLADSACAPYGERSDAFVLARSQAIAAHLRETHRIKALVVACNTATSVTIDALRRTHADLPCIGVEPALKPAAAATRTRRIGVMATRSTTASARFARLLAAMPDGVAYVVQPCDGLADAIERAAAGGLAAVASDTEVATLCTRYVDAMRQRDAQAGAIDTIVLGCTHYVLARAAIAAAAGPAMRLLDTGGPVARQARRLLGQRQLLAPVGSHPDLLLTATSDAARLRAIVRNWPQGRPLRIAPALLPSSPAQADSSSLTTLHHA